MKGSYSCVCSRMWMVRERHQIQYVEAICHSLQARTLVLLGTRVRKYVVEWKFQRIMRTLGFSRNADGRHIQVTQFPRDSSRNSHYRWVSWEKDELVSTSNLLSKTKSFSSGPHWQAIFLFLRCVSGMRLNIRHLHWEQRKTNSKSISNPNSWHWLLENSKQCQKLQATLCCNLQRITKRWFAKLLGSSICQNGGKWTILHCQMNLLWMETFLLHDAENTQQREILKVRDFQQFSMIMSRSDHWLELKYFKLAGTFAIEVQVPSQQWRISKSWVRILRELEQYDRNLIITVTDHQNLEAASSQQSIICGRPRAKEPCGNSPVRDKAAPKTKHISVGFSQRVQQKKWSPRGMVNSYTFWSTSWRFNGMEVVMKRTEQYNGIMFRQTCQVLIKLSIGTEKWIEALGRSTDKPRMEYWEDQNRTIIYHRAVQGHSRAGINPFFR